MTMPKIPLLVQLVQIAVVHVFAPPPSSHRHQGLEFLTTSTLGTIFSLRGLADITWLPTFEADGPKDDGCALDESGVFSVWLPVSCNKPCMVMRCMSNALIQSSIKF